MTFPTPPAVAARAVESSISDHSLSPIDYDPSAASDDVRAWFTLQKYQRELAARMAREIYEQAERDYHHHNRNPDGQS